MTNKETPELEMPSGCEEVRINVGYPAAVQIDKLYGPTGAGTLRVSIDLDDGVWLIEQEICERHEDGNCMGNVWVERARIPMQPMDDACYASMAEEDES